MIQVIQEKFERVIINNLNNGTLKKAINQSNSDIETLAIDILNQLASITPSLDTIDNLNFLMLALKQAQN